MDVERERRGWGRRRREHVPGGRRHAHLVKVSPEEEGALCARAGRLGVSVPRLLVESALSEGGGVDVERRAREDEARKEMLLGLFALRRAVGAIGVNLNQIAKATNATGEIEETLVPAVAHLRTVLRRLGVFMDGWGQQR